MNAETTPMRNVAILIFDKVEILDFCGPFEVFSVANRDAEPALFNVSTVADSASIVARGGLAVTPSHTLSEYPQADVLVIPGGVGVRAILEDSAILDWISAQATSAQLVTSVCTGALLLGRCGFLDGLKATTHHRCIEELRAIAPQAHVLPDRRFVDTGRLITSAGISAGIDMSLHIVRRLISHEFANDVAVRMEYDWRTQ